MREALKAAARLFATLLVTPMLVSFGIKQMVLGADRALEGSTQLLALVPGLVGQEFVEQSGAAVWHTAVHGPPWSSVPWLSVPLVMLREWAGRRFPA